MAATARADILCDLGRYDEALAAFEDALHHFPHNEAAATARAETLRNLGRYDEASSLLARVVSAEPGSSRAWCLFARAHLGADRYVEAVDSLPMGGVLWFTDGSTLERHRIEGGTVRGRRDG